MEKEPKFNVEPQFDTAINSLSFPASKALLAILLRDGIDERDKFTHVVGMEDEILDKALEELIKLGLVEKNKGIWDMTPLFRDYWAKSSEKGVDKET